MKISELLTETYINGVNIYVTDNIQNAIREAERTGMKVAMSAGNKYVVVPLTDPRPQVVSNEEYYKHEAELKKQVATAETEYNKQNEIYQANRDQNRNRYIGPLPQELRDTIDGLRKAKSVLKKFRDTVPKHKTL